MYEKGTARSSLLFCCQRNKINYIIAICERIYHPTTTFLLCFWKTLQYKRAKTVVDFLFARQNLMISNVNKIMVVLDLNDYKLGKKTLQKKKKTLRTWIFCETEN